MPLPFNCEWEAFVSAIVHDVADVLGIVDNLELERDALAVPNRLTFHQNTGYRGCLGTEARLISVDQQMFLVH